MAVVRVHELAKELNLTSAETIALLGKVGIRASTHMSAIDEHRARIVKGVLSGNLAEVARTVKVVPKVATGNGAAATKAPAKAKESAAAPKAAAPAAAKVEAPPARPRRGKPPRPRRLTRPRRPPPSSTPPHPRRRRHRCAQAYVLECRVVRQVREPACAPASADRERSGRAWPEAGPHRVVARAPHRCRAPV